MNLKGEPYKSIALALGSIALVTILYFCMAEERKGWEEHSNRIAEQELKEKNKKFDIVQIQNFTGRVKQIAQVGGHLLVVIEGADGIEEIAIPTYDTADIKLQYEVTFYYASIIFNNKEYKKGYILSDDFWKIKRVDDDYGSSFYNLFMWHEVKPIEENLNVEDDGFL